MTAMDDRAEQVRQIRQLYGDNYPLIKGGQEGQYAIDLSHLKGNITLADVNKAIQQLSGDKIVQYEGDYVDMQYAFIKFASAQQRRQFDDIFREVIPNRLSSIDRERLAASSEDLQALAMAPQEGRPIAGRITGLVIGVTSDECIMSIGGERRYLDETLGILKPAIAERTALATMIEEARLSRGDEHTVISKFEVDDSAVKFPKIRGNLTVKQLNTFFKRLVDDYIVELQQPKLDEQYIYIEFKSAADKSKFFELYQKVCADFPNPNKIILGDGGGSKAVLLAAGNNLAEGLQGLKDHIAGKASTNNVGPSDVGS